MPPLLWVEVADSRANPTRLPAQAPPLGSSPHNLRIGVTLHPRSAVGSRFQLVLPLFR